MHINKKIKHKKAKPASHLLKIGNILCIDAIFIFTKAIQFPKDRDNCFFEIWNKVIIHDLK